MSAARRYKRQRTAHTPPGTHPAPGFRGNRKALLQTLRDLCPDDGQQVSEVIEGDGLQQNLDQAYFRDHPHATSYLRPRIAGEFPIETPVPPHGRLMTKVTQIRPGVRLREQRIWFPDLETAEAAGYEVML